MERIIRENENDSVGELVSDEEKFKVMLNQGSGLKVVIETDPIEFERKVLTVSGIREKLRDAGYMYFESDITYDTQIKDGELILIAFIEYRYSVDMPLCGDCD
jgi:hypothetical protein